MQTAGALRVGAGVAAGAGYVVLCLWLMLAAPPTPWNAVGVLGPMLAALGIGCWSGGRRAPAAVAFALLAALAASAALGRSLPAGLMYLAQHAGVNLALAVGFASTLRPGRVALITLLARSVHRRFTPAMAAYARRCTWAWVVYFVAVAGVSFGLYAFASFETWAVYANVVSPLTVAAMFVGEHLFRYWRHPDFERVRLADAVRAYRERNAP